MEVSLKSEHLMNSGSNFLFHVVDVLESKVFTDFSFHLLINHKILSAATIRNQLFPCF